MTVCIGALCADPEGNPSKAAVVASDRMVTLGGLIEFEHEIPKVSSVADRIVILIAGDALRGARLVRQIASAIPVSSLSMDEVAQMAATAYVEHRRQQIEVEVFAPRGITISQYYGGLQMQMLPQIVGALDNHLATYNYGTDFLIAGVDDSGAHLYHLTHPGGIAQNFQTIGFTAIGTGSLHAVQSLIGFGHTPARGIDETIFSVYASKRRAEVAPGVGRDTDLMVVDQAGRRTLSNTALDQLEALYQEYQRPVSDELKKKVAKLNLVAEGVGGSTHGQAT